MKVPFIAAGLLAANTLAIDVDASIALNLSNNCNNCKCFPGDVCWPSTSDWDSLNQTVSGRLVATVPLGQACHDPNYDPVKCQALRDGWQNPATQ